MKESTRDKIIAAGAEIIHRKGFHHTGIQEVLQAANVPKGSFYFYFKNKEDFGLQVIDHFNQLFTSMAEPILADRSLPPLGRIEQLLDFFIELFTGLEYTCGCPIGNLSQEMGDLDPVFSQKLLDAIELMASLYTVVLEEAREAGELDRSLDPKETAFFIISGWHGALIRMKIAKTTEPLENHKRFVMKLVLQPPPAAV